MDPGAQGLDWGALPNEEARSRAFESIYAQCRDLVRRTAYALGGEQDLDEIVQESFVRLWKALPSFRGEASLKTFAYRVTLNTARGHWRGFGRRRAAALRYAGELALQAGPPGPDQDEGRLLRAAVARLPREQREAVVLAYFEGLSLAETAQACGVPEGTVKSRLFAARQTLKGVLLP